jgi:hypothetical protein
MDVPPFLSRRFYFPDGPQNFKYVRWQDVVQALKLP